MNVWRISLLIAGLLGWAFNLFFMAASIVEARRDIAASRRRIARQELWRIRNRHDLTVEYLKNCERGWWASQAELRRQEARTETREETEARIGA